jgi:hypothetical protein
MRCATLLFLMIAAALPLRAQSAAIRTEVDSLTWAQVVQRDGSPRTFTARIVSADSASIVFRHQGGFFFVPVSEIERMHISLGQPRFGVRRGARQGLVSGALVIGLMFLIGDGGCEDDCYFDLRAAAVRGAVPILLVSTGIGALSGLLPGKERWIRVQPPVTVRRAPAAPVHSREILLEP